MLDKSALKVENDSIDHINVYTRGRTRLGRAMSNLSDCNIDHPRHGLFRTLEGLWYYLKTGSNDDWYRLMSGYDCRKRGKTGTTVWNTNFHRDFKIGMVLKILSNPLLMEELKESTLPFTHYYFFGKTPDKLKLMVPKGHEWQMEFWESMRRQLKEGKDLTIVIEGLLKTDQDPSMV
jgi:hypothetical protein